MISTINDYKLGLDKGCELTYSFVLRIIKDGGDTKHIKKVLENLKKQDDEKDSTGNS